MCSNGGMRVKLPLRTQLGKPAKETKLFSAEISSQSHKFRRSVLLAGLVDKEEGLE